MASANLDEAAVDRQSDGNLVQGVSPQESDSESSSADSKQLLFSTYVSYRREAKHAILHIDNTCVRFEFNNSPPPKVPIQEVVSFVNTVKIHRSIVIMVQYDNLKTVFPSLTFLIAILVSIFLANPRLLYISQLTVDLHWFVVLLIVMNAITGFVLIPALLMTLCLVLEFAKDHTLKESVSLLIYFHKKRLLWFHVVMTLTGIGFAAQTITRLLEGVYEAGSDYTRFEPSDLNGFEPEDAFIAVTWICLLVTLYTIFVLALIRRFLYKDFVEGPSSLRRRTDGAGYNEMVLLFNRGMMQESDIAKKVLRFTMSKYFDWDNADFFEDVARGSMFWVGMGLAVYSSSESANIHDDNSSTYLEEDCSSSEGRESTGDFRQPGNSDYDNSSCYDEAFEDVYLVSKIGFYSFSIKLHIEQYSHDVNTGTMDENTIQPADIELQEYINNAVNFLNCPSVN